MIKYGDKERTFYTEVEIGPKPAGYVEKEPISKTLSLILLTIAVVAVLALFIVYTLKQKASFKEKPRRRRRVVEKEDEEGGIGMRLRRGVQ